MDTQITEGTLRVERFVWNDDCPAWPVRLHANNRQAFVTAPVLLAMVKAVATNTDTFGRRFVDDEDAVEQVAALAAAARAIYEGRAVYDVSAYVINTGSMEIDIIDAAGFEAIGEEDL